MREQIGVGMNEKDYRRICSFLEDASEEVDEAVDDAEFAYFHAKKTDIAAVINATGQARQAVRKARSLLNAAIAALEDARGQA